MKIMRNIVLELRKYTLVYGIMGVFEYNIENVINLNGFD